jgi:beta-glucosidase
VLLKNEGGALPLKAADLDSVVLIGPTAGQVDSIGINGERAVGLPQRQVGPLELRSRRSPATPRSVCRERRHDRHDRFPPAR